MAGLDILNPQISKVTKSIDNLIITIYGKGGLGKTPVATKMEKPLYLAFGKSGLDGLNNVPFLSVKSWSDFKNVNKQLCGKKDNEQIHEMYKTIIMDEMEVLYSYCEKYVASVEGVNKIKEGNGGFGLWGDLKAEWETEMLRLIGSGFCVVFILHTQEDDTGYNSPVGDMKRMLPILINHSAIIGYVKGNGVDEETGKPIHSSLMLAATEGWFARTRNEYFDPCIEDFTADNLVKAYYDALDRQAKAEGVKPITLEEKEQQYATPELDYDEIMEEINGLGERFYEADKMDEVTNIVEAVLGSGKKVTQTTAKQVEAVAIILSDLQDKAIELGI